MTVSDCLRITLVASVTVVALWEGRPSTQGDMLYGIDSESSATRHPGWKTGVRIGSTKEDKVLSFIPPHQTNNPEGAAGEGVAVDPEGNVYAAEGPISRSAAGGGLTKFVKR